MSVTEHTETDQGAERRSFHGEELRYRRVCSQVANTAWAILPETLAVIVDMLSYRAHGYRLTAEEVQERIEGRAPTSRAQPGSRGAVAVLAVYGVIAQRANAFESVSSPNGTGLDKFIEAFHSALADPEVGSILLDIDSPGGSVDGVPEAAAEIRKARGQKPIVAFANTDAASAAYWLASQADEIVVTPSGRVGSVGVFAAHQDLSAAMEQEGVKVTLISAGKFKVEGNPFEPLTEDARSSIQSAVDGYYDMFVADVAKGRGVAVADVRGGFGEGRMVGAKAAVAAGMADRVDTFDGTVARLQRGGVPATGARAEDLLHRQRAALAALVAEGHSMTLEEAQAAIAPQGFAAVEAEEEPAPEPVPDEDTAAAAPLDQSVIAAFGRKESA